MSAAPEIISGRVQVAMQLTERYCCVQVDQVVIMGGDVHRREARKLTDAERGAYNSGLELLQAYFQDDRLLAGGPFPRPDLEAQA